MRGIETGLVAALALAVLAFGGTEKLFFSVVQGLLFGLALALLLRGQAARLFPRGVPVALPAFLVFLVLLQLVPLPRCVVERVRSDGWLAAAASPAPISIAAYETRTHLLLLLTCLAVFYLTLGVCQQRPRRKGLVLALLALASFEAFYGLVQYLTGWQQIFTYVKSFNREEATGTYINRNHYAGLLGMLLPFALGWAYYGMAQVRAGAGKISVRLWLRRLFAARVVPKVVFWSFLAVILFTALIFSRSRMGLVAAVVSILTMGGVISVGARPRPGGLVLAGVFLAVAGLLAVWMGPGPIVGRFERLGVDWGPGEPSRAGIWRDTLELIRQHPLLGSGLGTFPIAYSSVQTTFLGQFVNHAHNDYLEIASDLGLAGALALFGSVSYLLVRLIGFVRAAEEGFERGVALAGVGSLCALLCHSLTDFNLYIPANALVFSCVLGLSVSVLPEQTPAEGT